MLRSVFLGLSKKFFEGMMMDIFDQVEKFEIVDSSTMLNKKFKRIFYTCSDIYGDIIVFHNSKDESYLLFQSEILEDACDVSSLDSLYPIPEYCQNKKLISIYKYFDDIELKLVVRLNFTNDKKLECNYSTYNNNKDVLMKTIQFNKVYFKNDCL